MKFVQLYGSILTANRWRKCALILALLILISLASACADILPGPNPLLPDSYNIDPVFQEFYDHLGGVQVLGPAISPLFIHDGINYQYTVSVLMVQNPHTPPEQRYSLASLGLELGIAEPPVAAPQHGDYYLNGHIIGEPFIPMFEMIGGLRYAGRPITEMRYNPEKQRYEQHFENIGMFVLEGEDEKEVGLQAYGAWKCNVSCRQPKIGASTVELIYRVDDVFQPTVELLGVEFTGTAISQAYRTPEGHTEQVFANVVLVAMGGDPNQIILRDITRRIGMHPEPLSAPSRDPGVFFLPVDAGGKLGYNIPQRFMDYLALHGGRDVSGAPIGELKQVGDGLFQQCFTNLCLEDCRDAKGALSVRPTQLGHTYKLWSQRPAPTDISEALTPLPTVDSQRSAPVVPDRVEDVMAKESSLPPTPSQSIQATLAPEISLRVWESYPWVSSSQAQEIGVDVFENDLPVSGKAPELVVFLPDGARKVFAMQPTNDEGQTRQLIDPIEAPNGTLILYQACLSNGNWGKFCVKSSFLIWQGK